MQPESAALLWDVHAAATRITEFIVGLDEASYAADELRRSAVERQLEIVGEALKNLRNADPATAGQVPDIARIIRLRNILAHGYTVVDDAVVWSAASQRVPELLAVVHRLLADMTFRAAIGRRPRSPISPKIGRFCPQIGVANGGSSPLQ